MTASQNSEPVAQALKAAGALVEEGRLALANGDITVAELRAMQALQQSPKYLDALLLLHGCRQKTNPSGPGYENLLRRIIRQNPNILQPTTELAFLLFARGERVECEQYARNALRLAPRHPRAHGVMGLILMETNRPAAGEFHFRRVIEIEGEHTHVAVHLANCLKAQGKLDEAETWFRKASELDPTNVQAWIDWCRLEEGRRDIPRAWELLHKAEKASDGGTDLRLTRAILYGREKKDAEAIAELSLSQAEGTPLTAMALLERGRLYDRMDRFGDAWADFTDGKRLCREVQGRRYAEAHAADLVARLKQFFTRARMSLIPRAARDETAPQPIFIVGYPRSGTTMVEQTLSAHPLVSAGDELAFIDELTRMAPRWLGSPHPYPACLADLWMGDNRLAPDRFRDYYLRGAQQLGIWEPGIRYFTDKMPLNETHLGFIHILFPKSPIIHLRRHPLDILLSNYANFLTHGYHQAFDVTTCATHYALIDGLVEHYKHELDLNYLEIRYENLVADQERQVRRLLDFIGLDFDPRCVAFHENQRTARTASYAQVSEKLYDRSVYRYKHYRNYLGDAVTILKPSLDRMGYSVD
ncbi:MAG: sulfotransferase [Rhizomicrobium sp.]|jgi:tetratricopeptide (TPR) repeat protein